MKLFAMSGTSLGNFLWYFKWTDNYLDLFGFAKQCTSRSNKQ